MQTLQIRENISLQPFNTFGIEATARYFAGFHSLDELSNLLSDASIRPVHKMILGGGSNILFTGNYDGAVLQNNILGIDITASDDEFVYVRSGAGESWHGLVLHCIGQGYGGMENLSLIPGNVGASPMQNIGAYGVEIKDIFHELEAVHMESGEIKRFGLDDCRFGYRESVFKNIYKNQFAITSVSFRLRKEPVFNISYGAIQQELEKMGVTELSVKAISDAVIRIRTSKLPDPKETGNAGSFFKNPQVSMKKFQELHEIFPSVVGYPQGEGMKLAAGWLIEQCGWKGYRQGDAGCYPKQALVLVNYGKATGKEIYDLSVAIIRSVQEKFGVELEREVNVVG